MYVFKTLFSFAQLQMDSIKVVFENDELQKVMREEKFDMVIFEGIMGDAFIGFGAHFKCPTVVFNSFPPTSFINDFIGNLDHISFVGNPMLSHNDEPMNFIERVLSFIMNFIVGFFWSYLRSLHLQAYE